RGVQLRQHRRTVGTGGGSTPQVILIDANILIYAYNPESEHHLRAKDWLENAFSQPDPVRLAWQSILAFLRITTNIHVFRRPFSTIEAISIIRIWLDQPSVAV